jgi:transposase
MHDATSLPDDLDACHQLIEQLSSRLQSQQDQLDEQARDLQSRETFVEEQSRTVVAMESSREQLSHENEELKLTVQKLLARLYGRRSESLVDGEGQLKLDFGDNAQAMVEALEEAVLEAERTIEDAEARRKAKRREKKRQHNGQLPPHLPREERIIKVAEDLKYCPAHGERQVIRYDETETLVFDRPRLRVLVTKYPVLSCPGKPKCGIASPERPTGLVEGNRFDVSVAVEIIAAKYFYHLPYYRQQDMFAGSGWTPSRSTLLNILTAAEFALQPLASYYHDLISEIDALGCDETTVTLIVPPGLPTLDPRNPRSRRILEVLSKAQAENRRSVSAKMWAYRSVVLPFNLFDFTVSRHRDGPDEILSGFSGKLMGDCWSGFQKIELRSDARIVRAACWAHARRKLHECRASHPQHTTVLLGLIRQLYDLEDRAELWTQEERLRLRQGESTRVLGQIREYLDSEAIDRVLPKSDLGKALGYLRRHWDALQVYANDGRLPIDNNETEQLMKQVALGRKNWLFAGSVAAGERAANLMTIISTAARNDLDGGGLLERCARSNHGRID